MPLCKKQLTFDRPELHANSHLGKCVLNALNVKRGFWRMSSDMIASSGVSPYGSTPESAAYASSAAGHRSGSTSDSNKSASVHRIDSSDSPRGLTGTSSYASEDRSAQGKVPNANRVPDSDPMKHLDSMAKVVEGQASTFFINSAEEQAKNPEKRRLWEQYDNTGKTVDGQVAMFPPYTAEARAALAAEHSSASQSLTGTTANMEKAFDLKKRLWDVDNSPEERVEQVGRTQLFPPAPGLTTDMETVFDGTMSVDGSGQRMGLSVMREAGAFGIRP